MRLRELAMTLNKAALEANEIAKDLDSEGFETYEDKSKSYEELLKEFDLDKIFGGLSQLLNASNYGGKKSED